MPPSSCQDLQLSSNGIGSYLGYIYIPLLSLGCCRSFDPAFMGLMERPLYIKGKDHLGQTESCSYVKSTLVMIR